MTKKELHTRLEEAEIGAQIWILPQQARSSGETFTKGPEGWSDPDVETILWSWRTRSCYIVYTCGDETLKIA